MEHGCLHNVHIFSHPVLSVCLSVCLCVCSIGLAFKSIAWMLEVFTFSATPKIYFILSFLPELVKYIFSVTHWLSIFFSYLVYESLENHGFWSFSDIFQGKCEMGLGKKINAKLSKSYVLTIKQYSKHSKNNIQLFCSIEHSIIFHLHIAFHS